MSRYNITYYDKYEWGVEVGLAFGYMSLG